jgi:hypothetical protein
MRHGPNLAGKKLNFLELRHGEVRRIYLLAASHRLQHFLWALEALDRRVPYLSDYGLRSVVALGVRGYLLLVSREVRAPQVLLELAQVEVVQPAR